MPKMFPNGSKTDATRMPPPTSCTVDWLDLFGESRLRICVTDFGVHAKIEVYLSLVGCTERPFLVEATTTTQECLVNGRGGFSRVLRNPRMFLLKLLVARCNDDSSLNGRAVAHKRVDVDNPERESSQHQASDGPWPESFHRSNETKLSHGAC
jgi:hypothetical protein